MNAKTASIIFGIVFLLVGILGFIPNPIIFNSHDALFHADTVHSSVHIISGLLFLTVGWGAPTMASMVLKIFGVVYFFLGVLGLLNMGDDGMAKLLGFLCVNGPDNILHIVLGAVIFFAGMLRPSS
ncbi:MAG: DUF4383 domain-containing protein [Flavobacterium sp.]